MLFTPQSVTLTVAGEFSLENQRLNLGQGWVDLAYQPTTPKTPVEFSFLRIVIAGTDVPLSHTGFSIKDTGERGNLRLARLHFDGELFIAKHQSSCDRATPEGNLYLALIREHEIEIVFEDAKTDVRWGEGEDAIRPATDLLVRLRYRRPAAS